MFLKKGALLKNGKYRIIEVLGQGGFGITYLAEIVQLRKPVALKEFFPKDFCGRNKSSQLTVYTSYNMDTVQKLKTRFMKEAENIGQLDHEGVVKIRDIFEENSTAYYEMDFIKGRNLSELVKTVGPLEVEKARAYILKVAKALQHIHSHNMTHFDVKPANIVLKEGIDEPILIDFGLSKQFDQKGEATSSVLQAASNGFSPIEFYNSSKIKTFSPQSDVYSLGATMYYLVTGNIPPHPTELLENGLSFQGSVPRWVREIITKAMKPLKNHRFQNMGEMIKSLEERKTVGVESKSKEAPQPKTAAPQPKTAKTNAPNPNPIRVKPVKDSSSKVAKPVSNPINQPVSGPISKPIGHTGGKPVGKPVGQSTVKKVTNPIAVPPVVAGGIKPKSPVRKPKVPTVNPSESPSWKQQNPNQPVNQDYSKKPTYTTRTLDFSSFEQPEEKTNWFSIQRIIFISIIVLAVVVIMFLLLAAISRNNSKRTYGDNPDDTTEYVEVELK